MTGISYTTDLSGVDWTEMKTTLLDDQFDNGRTVGQLRASFENSQRCCVAYAKGRIVGTARVLSDGVCNAYVLDVWTLSSYRRQGIAKRMMEILEEGLTGQHVHLSSDLPEVYERMGYARQDVSLSKDVGRWLQNDSLSL